MKQTNSTKLQHIWIVAVFLTAVVCGLGAGYFIGSGGVSPRRAMATARVYDCREGVESLEPQIRSDRFARHRYIPETRVGPYRSRAVRVVSVDSDRRYATESVSAGDARQGLCKTFRAAALRKRGKAPLKERYAQTRRGISVGGGSGKDGDEGGPIIYPDDVYIDGIPMVDQGKKAYCAAAAAARVLQGYGIEITMEDMVALAGSSDTKGTNVNDWEKALRQVASDHGLRLKTVSELTESCNPFSAQLRNYNAIAEIMDCSQVDVADYLQPGLEDRKGFWEDREYPVQRNVMLTDDRKCAAFEENVIGRIDESDPIFWRVTTGDISEQRVDTSENMVRYYERDSHMRLIVGYNEARGEVIYSDSWGEGHAHKRMDAQDALSITTGMYYLAD